MKHTILGTAFERLNKLLFLWIASIVINIITLLLIMYQIKPGEHPLALHYNVLTGVDWYGQGSNIYLIPGIGFSITVVNFVFFRALKGTPGFLRPLCAAISFLVQITLLATVLFLMKVN